jgi:hypothetical protein
MEEVASRAIGLQLLAFPKLRLQPDEAGIMVVGSFSPVVAFRGPSKRGTESPWWLGPRQAPQLNLE